MRECEQRTTLRAERAQRVGVLRDIPRHAARTLAALAVLGCAPLLPACVPLLWRGVAPVPIAELDRHGRSLDLAQALRPGDGPERVLAVLGEPSDRRPSLLGETVWRYAIRAWSDIAEQRTIVPAARLRLSFDASALLDDWWFVDAQGVRLPVRESPAEADRWYRSLARAPRPTPPRVVLEETLVRGRTTQAEVERELGRWHPDLRETGGPVTLFQERAAASGEIWDWYVDRPSPLFVPPRYLIASFDRGGTLMGWHFQSTYPGGRE
jgi:hypothetical protein